MTSQQYIRTSRLEVECFTLCSIHHNPLISLSLFLPSTFVEQRQRQHFWIPPIWNKAFLPTLSTMNNDKRFVLVPTIPSTTEDISDELTTERTVRNNIGA
ncbi:hypothetical protein CDL12_29150 [Handroanthus impetiginosus]|uniref:Uncharacterized protein n=1 Tax=Handroanthus impetiginosus TaxID=429701 RepID=A0A2G9FZK4_9LAMI|nr:hypothetical protein CDL12_29150 [Handroanthus impetiginosus]